MMRLIISVLLAAAVVAAKAAPGDTIKVQSHNKVHMNWNGNFDRKAKFPDVSKSFNKILMHYTLGCPTGGCSEWDYTTQIFARKPTGMLDSTLKTTPNFKVNGTAKDSVWYSNTVTYKYHFDTLTKQTDSTANDTLKIEIYGDSTKPLVITSTIIAWPGNYYKPVYDSLGVQTDSVYVGFDTKLILKNWSYYSVFEIIESYEMGRVITPYNGNVPNTWTYTYTFDVTDFATLLRDSAVIRAHYSGYQDGFTVTLDFEFVEGTPARECYKIVSLWQGSHAYGNPNNDIENFLVPRTVPVDAQMKQAKIRIIQTGHGFGGADGCAEFCQKDHFIKIGGTTRFQKTIWRDNCGLNPVFPQGGTWVYNRSNWCPGAEVAPYDYDVTQFITAGSNAAIDMDMESYINQGNSNTSYIVSGMLFLYKENNFITDASIEEVMAPNNKLRYARFNPVCDYPEVRVMNNGNDSITSIEFSYGPQGGGRATYTWQGSLAPHAGTVIKMGNNIDFTGAAQTKIFEVEITKVNTKTDEVAYNNKMNTQFDATPVFPARFVVWLRTNNQASENSYTIKNHLGNVVHSRNNMTNGTQYRDTVDLMNGCYTFEILDNGNDGLSFWANPNAGSGTLLLRRADNGQVVKNYSTDFGTSIVEYFTVGFSLGAEELATKNTGENSVTVYPNPSTGEFWLDVSLAGSREARVQVMDLAGKIITDEMVSADNFNAYLLDFSGQSNGIYILKVSSADAVFTKRLVKTN